MVSIAAVSIVLSMLSIGSAGASDAVVIIKAAGEAFDGPPKLRLLADGRLVGERTLGKSIDTGSGQKLRRANRKDHIEWLKFKVPGIQNVTKLEIEFANDAWAGRGKSGDRNLFVYRLFIDGYQFRPNFMVPVPAKSGDVHAWEASLRSNGRLQLHRPPKGWTAGYKATSAE
jgi:hypothetical protein